MSLSKNKFPVTYSIALSVILFHTINGIIIKASSHERSRTKDITNDSGPTSPIVPESNRQLSPDYSQPYNYQSPYPYASSYYPSYYNLSRQDDNNGFGFDNGGNGGFGGNVGGGVGGGDIGFGATGGGGGTEALGVGGGILAAIGLAFLAIILIPLILLLLLGLLILPFSPLLLLLLLLLIPAAQKKIVFGEPPGTGIFPRSFYTSDYFSSTMESVFNIILQAIEGKDIPCADPVSCQNPIENEVRGKRESPVATSHPTERSEWKKLITSALKQTQAFTFQVVKRINNMKKNVSKIGSSAAATAISKISKIAS